MTSRTWCLHLRLLTFAVLLVITATLLASAQGHPKASADVRGTWSGSFFSKHNNTAPFTMTVVISPDDAGHLIGNSSTNSDCLGQLPLQVTVTGSHVVLAGSNEEGDNITIRATLDSTGTILKGRYILNGSASGKCETDDGTGNLSKR